MKIEVILRNISPIFSATPGSDTISLDGRYNPPGGGFPLTSTRKMRVPASVGEGALKPVAVPVVPGNSMRNLLRRSILEHFVMPQLTGRDRLSIGAYAAAFAGSATGNPKGVATFDDIVATRAHVFLGLFGGGPRMMQGRLTVDTLYPIHQHAQRLLGPGYEERMLSGNLVDVVWSRRVDPILKTRDENAQEVIKDGPQALTQWAVDAMQASAAKSAKRGAKKGADEAEPAAEEGNSARGLSAFNAHEVVIPGVDWLLRIELEKPTDAQVGLVLAGLAKIPQMTIAGGFAKGYGKNQIEAVNLDGEAVWAGGSYVDSSELNRYFDAMAEQLETLDASGFEAFIASTEDEK